VAELRDGDITEYTITPEQFGVTRTDLSSLKVADAGESLRLIKALLAGEKSAASDIVALNSGAALYAANVANSLDEGVKTAQAILSSGQGLIKLNELVEVTGVIKQGQP
jgi:anthranilate phosphoribosyltransferase